MVPLWGGCTTHFRTYFTGWIGMLTGGTIWLLAHGQWEVFACQKTILISGQTKVSVQAWLLLFSHSLQLLQNRHKTQT